MPHTYKLHTPVTVPCSCCGLLYQARFSNNREDVICTKCSGHKSSNMPGRERERQHRDMWLSELNRYAGDARSAKALRAKAEELQKQLDDLIETSLSDAPDGVRARWETEQLLQAEREKYEANRHRDAAEAALLSVYYQHHPSRERPGRCSCGNLEKDCLVRFAIQGLDRRLEWLERTQGGG